MSKSDDEKYMKIVFSMRMLKFHGFITETQFRNMIIKLQKKIFKEQNMKPNEIAKYIDKIWFER